MKNISYSAIFKKTLAIILMAYFSIFSPVVALAQVTQPVSAPISIPVPVPTPTPSPTPTPTPSPSPSPSPIPQATIFVNNYSVKSGENLNVSWNVPNASNTDYIRVLTTDGTNRSVGPNGISPSNNCNLNNISGPNASKVGSCTFTSAVIADLGTFKLGYYNSSGVLLASSNPFHVQAASNGTFSANPTNIGIGQSVNLTWANITNTHPKDYINYLNADTYTGGGTAHTYWPSGNCTWFPTNTAPSSSGSCSIEGPYSSGNYKLVYRSGNVPIGQPAPILAVTNVVAVSQNTPKPDLVVDLKANVESLGVGVSGSANSKLTITATVKNIGSASATPSVTRISTDNINEYWRLGTNNLNPGASQTLTVTTYKGPGTYQFKASADADSQVSESSEDNNTASLNLTILPPSCNIGDINNDGKIDSTDARLVLRYTAGLEKFTNEQKKRADVNADGQINSIDALQINQYFLGLIKSFAACSPQVNIPTINSITPQSGAVGSLAQVAGSNFGNSQGFVILYNQKGQASARASILGWYDNGIKFRVPSVAKGTYQVEIKTSDGRKSNRVNFTVTAAQPVINSISPTILRVGNYMYIYGNNFGTSGKVNFYPVGSTAASASAINQYWSNSVIIARIPTTLVANRTYGIQVRSISGTDLLDSSLIYRYISR